MSSVVLDASALLALLNDEPGADVVASNLDQALIVAVNWSEVVGKLVDGGMPEQAILTALGSLGLKLRPFDEELAHLAGMLRVKTRPLGLSLGDRACLALAARLSLPVLTADRSWSTLKVGVKVRLIR